MSMDDAFDEAEAVPVKQLITAGRYRLPNRDGTPHKGGWMRVSNLASALSDTRALNIWELNQTLLGMRARPDYLEALAVMDVYAMEPGVLRKELERIVRLCKEAARADEGSRRGRARHSMVEHWHATGGEIGTMSMREQLAAYRAAMDAHKLRAVPGMQERIMIIESLNAAGRFDNVTECLLTGERYIADLKTQRRWWTLLEVRAQLAMYANGDALWNEECGRYEDMPAVSREVGHVLWMPKEPSRTPGSKEPDPEEPAVAHEVHILNVDLVKGWATAQRAYEIVRDRSEAKSVSALRECVRPLPAPVSVVVRTVEEFAARFRAAGSVEDGRRIMEEAKTEGLWGPELHAEARRLAARLRGQST